MKTILENNCLTLFFDSSNAVGIEAELFAAVFIPGLLPSDRAEYLKRTALDYVNGGLEPLCFQ